MKADGEPCDRVVPVFDGKQRYDLRFERVADKEVDVRGYEGPAVKCNVYYTPVSGFDPEDLASPETYERPLQMWLADVGGGLYLPVHIRGNVSGMLLRGHRCGCHLSMGCFQRVTPLNASRAISFHCGGSMIEVAGPSSKM